MKTLEYNNYDRKYTKFVFQMFTELKKNLFFLLSEPSNKKDLDIEIEASIKSLTCILLLWKDKINELLVSEDDEILFRNLIDQLSKWLIFIDSQKDLAYNWRLLVYFNALAESFVWTVVRTEYNIDTGFLEGHYLVANQGNKELILEIAFARQKISSKEELNQCNHIAKLIDNDTRVDYSDDWSKLIIRQFDRSKSKLDYEILEYHLLPWLIDISGQQIYAYILKL